MDLGVRGESVKLRWRMTGIEKENKVEGGILVRVPDSMIWGRRMLQKEGWQTI